jgi:hypothetical protein
MVNKHIKKLLNLNQQLEKREWKPPMGYHVPLIRMAFIKPQKKTQKKPQKQKTSVGENVEKSEPCAWLVGI